MAYKVNYNHQRAERDRAKQAKKEAKLREKEEAAARRKAGLEGEPSLEMAADTPDGSGSEVMDTKPQP